MDLAPYIVKWADYYDISVPLLSGILYDELRRTSKSYGFAEKIAAYVGLETSPGIASMKPATAELVEKKGLVPAAGNRYERVRRLNNEEWAVRYAAAYLRLITNELVRMGDPQSVTDEMIATNYSLSKLRLVELDRGVQAVLIGRKLMAKMGERWVKDERVTAAVKRPWKTRVTLE